MLPRWEDTMKKYLFDFVRAMWKMALIATLSVAGSIWAIKQQNYLWMTVFGGIVVVVACLWAPWLEESFKMTHSDTKNKAFVFGLVEFILYAYQIPIGFMLFMVLRMPMLILHVASGLCYYHYPNNRMKWFWFINHSAWNAIACFSVNWLYTGNSIATIRPTLFTICVTTFWATSLCFKLFRKKLVEITV